MADFLTLPVIARIWAGGGQATDPIPETQAQTAASNRASQQMGFPEITSQPIADGGRPPVRLDFNGIFKVLSTYAYALQQGQTITYSSDVSAKIGGYPKGAVLWYILNGVPQYLVQSLVENNTTADLTDGSKWQPISLNPAGMAMTGTLSNQQTAQVRNIEIVSDEPDTGVDGTIYAIME